MSGVLIDTSVWVSFFRGGNESIREEINRLLLENQVCICPPIYQEILQGVKDEFEFDRLRDLLDALIWLDIPYKDLAFRAANLFFSLRTKGISIRKSMDCQIAVFAIHFKVPIFEFDRDFELIQRGTDLKLYKP
ncbi:MAG: toxin-antitoxin system COG1487 family toxin component [Algoriphagus marincola HL-49]|uniref:Toxin-antitoxin system COG1487 family toxin component n=1 Tax=Algoriphagus marincola HL-49 TaxID=1305737 RepID=A0A0N8KD46_9BACT|nr:MAG: toxin-antitoxin system COG1487 family toxin component [Algoriphagus marincola HL-49]